MFYICWSSTAQILWYKRNLSIQQKWLHLIFFKDGETKFKKNRLFLTSHFQLLIQIYQKK